MSVSAPSDSIMEAEPVDEENRDKDTDLEGPTPPPRPESRSVDIPPRPASPEPPVEGTFGGIRRMTKRITRPLMEAGDTTARSLQTCVTDRCLRFLQIVLQFAIFASGLLVCLTLWWTVRIYNDSCPLYANMYLDYSANGTITLNSETVWSELNPCLFCTFMAVAACIYAIIWFWFFILMTDWGLKTMVKDGPPPDLVMMIPTTAVNVLLFICSFAVAGLTTAGVNEWCSSIERNGRYGYPCSYVRDHTWENVPDGNLTYSYLSGTVAGSWLLLFMLGGQSAVASIRMYLYYRNQMEGSDDEEELTTDDSEDLGLAAFASSSTVISLSDSDQTETEGFYHPSAHSTDDKASGRPKEERRIESAPPNIPGRLGLSFTPDPDIHVLESDTAESQSDAVSSTATATDS